MIDMIFCYYLMLEKLCHVNVREYSRGIDAGRARV